MPAPTIVHTEERCRIFISYAHDDIRDDGMKNNRYKFNEEYVPGLVGKFLQCLSNCYINIKGCDQLSKFEKEVFFDVIRLTAGDTLTDEIKNAIFGCNVFIALMGAGFNRSKACADEVALAIEYNKPIAVVLLRALHDGWQTKKIKNSNKVLKDFVMIQAYDENRHPVAVGSQKVNLDDAMEQVGGQVQKFLEKHVYPKRQDNTSSFDVLPPVTYFCDQDEYFGKIRMASGNWHQDGNKLCFINLQIYERDECSHVVQRVLSTAFPHTKKFHCEPIGIKLISESEMKDSPKLHWARSLISGFQGDFKNLKNNFSAENFAEILDQSIRSKYGFSDFISSAYVYIPNSSGRSRAEIAESLKVLIDLLESVPKGHDVLRKIVVFLIDSDTKIHQSLLDSIAPNANFNNIEFCDPGALNRIKITDVKDWRKKIGSVSNHNIPDIDTIEKWFGSLKKQNNNNKFLALGGRIRQLLGHHTDEHCVTLGEFHEAFKTKFPDVNINFHLKL